ncbi:tail fiber protein [Testudinibacter aquarius]|uniref:Tail fiber-like repeat protein n=1 Tax=Testudinibacter aquarius TaxID=1524974 RepID=A0A4R3Y9E4_9PAST|nr:tail fiber protein [Testudinibacter aquarius]KAE9526061.1 hypothetical protein A1D24_03245 [Testudinibacter aquarius]TCV87254.1 tail fiber-like repeat protein [Testudinibacter aquarius]TNG87534.1 hypothetical protein FHQ21_12045 [Testudinibacter aquarius]
MTKLVENPKWEEEIYQLEKTDPVVAGLDGIANRQAQQLANRTNYLKTEQDKLKTATEAASTTKSGTTKLSSSTTSSSEAEAATPLAVKTAMDRANEAHTLADGKAPLDSPALTGSPTAPTAAQTVNSTQIATTAFVKSAIAELVGGAPAQLDTLKEIATALGNNANLNSTLLAEIGKKANASHTHTAANITDFNTAVTRLFTQSYNNTGWAKLPNGLIIQWGRLTIKVPRLGAAASGQYITFPIAFPTSVFAIAGDFLSGISERGGVHKTLETQENHRFWLRTISSVDVENAHEFKWFALGI